MNIRMARRCLNGGCQEAIQCPEGRCALHAAMHAPAPCNEGTPALAAPEAAEPVATVHGAGWELDDAEVRVFGVPARTWRLSFACTQPELEARGLADKINAAAKLAPTDSQAGRDAVEARGWREVLKRAKDGLGAGGRSHGEQPFIDYGAALIDHIEEELDRLSTTTGRAAE